MHATHLLPLTLVSGVLAAVVQSSVNIFAVAYPVVAYVLESEANVATTYLVACPKGVKKTSCPFNQPYTLTEGPKTARWSYVASTGGLAQELTLGCILKGTTSMGCKATGLAAPGKTTTEAFTWTGKEASTLFRNVALVTDSSSLLTYTPGALISSGADQRTTSLANPTSSPKSVRVTSKPTAEPSKTLSDSTSSSTSRAKPLENPPSSIWPSPVSSPSSSITSVVALGSPTVAANGAAPVGIGRLGQVVMGGMAAAVVIAGRI